MTTFLLVLALVILVVSLYFYLAKNKDNSEKGRGATEAPGEYVAPRQKDGLSEIESIIKTEEKFVLNNHAGLDLNTKLKEVSDVLLRVVEPLNMDFSTTEITFKLNEVANQTLPQKINAFIGLNTDQQQERKEEFIADMDKFLDFAKQADDIINQTNISKDERESLLIGIKY